MFVNDVEHYARVAWTTIQIGSCVVSDEYVQIIRTIKVPKIPFLRQLQSVKNSIRFNCNCKYYLYIVFYCVVNSFVTCRRKLCKRRRKRDSFREIHVVLNKIFNKNIPSSPSRLSNCIIENISQWFITWPRGIQLQWKRNNPICGNSYAGWRVEFKLRILRALLRYLLYSIPSFCSYIHIFLLCLAFAHCKV